MDPGVALHGMDGDVDLSLAVRSVHLLWSNQQVMGVSPGAERVLMDPGVALIGMDGDADLQTAVRSVHLLWSKQVGGVSPGAEWVLMDPGAGFMKGLQDIGTTKPIGPIAMGR